MQLNKSNYAILYFMSEDLAPIERWASHLRRWGLTRVSISFLESTKPLSLLVSQFLRMGIFTNVGSGEVNELADLFEDNQTCDRLISLLNEESLQT